jgi:hypothetical protein
LTLAPWISRTFVNKTAIKGDPPPQKFDPTAMHGWVYIKCLLSESKSCVRMSETKVPTIQGCVITLENVPQVTSVQKCKQNIKKRLNCGAVSSDFVFQIELKGTNKRVIKVGIYFK